MSAAPGSALLAVQKLALTRRLRLRGYFLDFDRLNHKRITASQFDRAIGAARLPLTPAQVDELKAQYAVGQGAIDYDTFCREVDTVFFVEGLEQSPTKQVRLTLAGEQLHQYGQNVTEEQRAAAGDALREVAREVRLRGVILKNFFRDFDPNNTGYVSKSRFCRGLQTALPRTCDFAVADALSKIYEDSAGQINYRALHDDTNDLEPAAALEATSPGKPGEGSGGIEAGLAASFRANTGMAQDARQALDKLTRIVSERRVRLGIFFQDWDKMRTGCVKARIFKATLCTALSNMLDPREVDLLASHYAVPNSPDNFVSYKKMLDYIDLAFNPRGLERDPLRGCESEPWEIAHRPRIVIPTLPGSREQACQEALNDIRSMVMQSRSSLIDIFRDFDRQSKGIVSETQFLRVLAIRKIMPADEQVRELIMQKYGITTGGGNGARVIQYRPFLDRVSTFSLDPKDAAKIKAQAAAAAAASAEPTVRSADSITPAELAATWHTAGVDDSQVLYLLRQFVAQRRVRVSTFFRDADPMNKGSINVTRFRRCLKELTRGSDLTANQLMAIEQRYCIGGAGDLSDPKTWIAGQPQIDWRTLAADIEAATHVANLEQDPTADVLALTQSIRNEGKRANSSLTSDEQAQLDAAMRDLAAVVRRNNSLTRPLFAKFDRIGRGQIPWTQFRRGVTMLCGGTHFNYITDLIAKSEFAVRQTGEGVGENYLVDYKKVCNVIDPVEQRRIAASPAVLRGDARQAANATNDTASVESVIVRIREAVKGRGISLKLFFEDYDKLRRGLVSEDRFFRSLDTALSTNFRLSQAEQRALCEAYARPGADLGMVDYMRFVNEIDQLTHLETQPLGTVPEWAKWEFTEGVPMEELSPLLDQLSRSVNERRMDVKMAFKNFDKTNRGVVTKTQFLSILTYLGIFPANPADRDLLCKAYQLREPGQGDKIHYATFAKRVDPPTNGQ
jgi:Ca2+-binding EF-hand superfamily protein